MLSAIIFQIIIPQDIYYICSTNSESGVLQLIQVPAPYDFHW